MEEKAYYEDTIELAMQYMTEKYGMQFTPISYDISDYLSSKDTVECITDEMDPEQERIFVSVEMVPKTENSDETEKVFQFHDSYFGRLIRPAMEEGLTRIFRAEFNKVKVFRDAINSPLPDHLGPDSSLSDFYKELPSYRMCVKIYVGKDPDLSQDEFENRMKRLEKRLMDSGHRYTIYLKALPYPEFEKIDRYVQDENEQDDVPGEMNDPAAEEMSQEYTYYATISDREVHRYG